jgi:hypothetical protein
VHLVEMRVVRWAHHSAERSGAYSADLWACGLAARKGARWAAKTVLQWAAQTGPEMVVDLAGLTAAHLDESWAVL